MRGGEKSLYLLATHLAESHTVRIFGQEGSEDRFCQGLDVPTPRTVTRLPIEIEHLRQWWGCFNRGRRALRRFDPDLILSQHEMGIAGAWHHLRYGTSHIVFLHDREYLRKPEGVGRTRFPVNAINYGVGKVSCELPRIVLAYSSLVCANSEWTATQFRDALGIRSEIMYPFIEGGEFEKNSSGEKILHVTPHLQKGISITLTVAERLPDEEFLIVGGGAPPTVEARMEELDNVTYGSYVPDISEAYRQARVVLMPSVRPEPFGMVPIEAGVHGVPTICSGKGGLPESVGHDEFIVRANEADAYIEALYRIDEDYDHHVTLTRSNAQRKTADERIPQFEEMVEDQLKLKL